MHGFKKSAFILLIFSTLFLFSCSRASAEGRPDILYFFSPSCPHCREVLPLIKDLSAEFKVEGLVYGNGITPELPFPVQKGSKEAAARYGVKGVPTIVALKDGVFRQLFSGAHDIRDAKVILKAMTGGALNVSEAREKAPEAEFTICGWIVGKGEYFNKDQKVFLTDRRNELEVKPWLLREAVKSPFQARRPRLMSDVMNKPVVLKGRIVKSGQGVRFQVTEEIRLD